MRLTPDHTKKITGTLRMARSQGPKGTYFRLTLEDEASSLIVMEVELTAEDLGLLLASSTTVEGVEVNLNPNIGRYLEVATVRVPLTAEDFPPRTDPKGDAADETAETLAMATTSWRRSKCLAAMQAAGVPSGEGWVPDVPSAYNHRRVNADGYSVDVRRYADHLA